MSSNREHAGDARAPGRRAGGVKWVEHVGNDLRRSHAATQVFIAILVAISLTALGRSYRGYRMYVLEPGLDDGYVYAETHEWWRLSRNAYELQRLRNTDGDITWHVRKRGSDSDWHELYGPDEDGRLVMWFPE